MPVTIISKVEGLKGLERSLSELGQTYGNPKYALQALRPAIKQALLPLVSAIQSNTPKDTGYLASTTKLVIKKAGSREKRSAYFNKDSVIVGLVGWFWTSGQSQWNKALSVEFGNASTAAQAVLRPAFDNNSSQMLSTFRRTLKESIEKKARMLNRKYNKGR